MGVGSEIGQICGVFSSKDSKNAHFLTFFERLHPPNNFKNKKQALGALPQTPLSLARPQGAGGKPYPPTPTVSVGSIQGVKGKMHDFVALTPLHLRGVAKLTEADGAGNLSRLAKQPRSNAAFTGWRRQRSVVRVQEVFPCTPATWRSWRVWAAPTVLARPLGVAQ